MYLTHFFARTYTTMGGCIFYEQTLIDVHSISGIADNHTLFNDEHQNGRKTQTLQ